MMMAGIDGVQNKMHPGDPIDKNLYDLPPSQAKKVPNVCSSLDMALEHLDKDRAFLTAAECFRTTCWTLTSRSRWNEVTRFRMTTHPVEFDMYYSL